ncbi:hypothetical protein DRP05_03495 [Archaeoglobales archaeon]|nr:MAG: hypothetical protein DRP05_03495 [Archaeoglobales archaeon]
MLRYVLQTIVGLIILLVLVLKITANLENLKFIRFDLTLFFLSILAYTMLNLTLSFRIAFLIDKMGVKIEYAKALISHLGGMVIGDVTPGRSGYLLTSKILDKFTNCGTDRGLAAIIAPQGVEFVLKALGALIAILYFFTKVSLNNEFYYAFLVAILLVFVGGAVFLILSWTREEKSKGLIEKIPYARNFSGVFVGFKDSSIKIRSYLLHILILYMIGWLVSGLQWYLIGKSLGMGLDYVDFFLLHPLITTLMFVPITPAGLGIMESGSVLVLYLLGVNPSIALVFSILARLSNLIGDLPGLYAVFSRKLV